MGGQQHAVEGGRQQVCVYVCMHAQQGERITLWGAAVKELAMAEEAEAAAAVEANAAATAWARAKA